MSLRNIFAVSFSLPFSDFFNYITGFGRIRSHEGGLQTQAGPSVTEISIWDKLKCSCTFFHYASYFKSDVHNVI